MIPTVDVHRNAHCHLQHVPSVGVGDRYHDVRPPEVSAQFESALSAIREQMAGDLGQILIEFAKQAKLIETKAAEILPSKRRWSRSLRWLRIKLTSRITDWSTYLQRLEGHVGVPQIWCLHHAEDGVNDRHFAQFIIGTLNQRQRELALPEPEPEDPPPHCTDLDAMD